MAILRVRTESLTRNLGILLAFIVALQFGYPISEYGAGWAALYFLLYAGMIGYGILVSKEDGGRAWPMAIIGVAYVAWAIWYAFDQDNNLAYVGMLLSVAVFMLSLALSLGRFIFRRRQAEPGALVIAAVAVYLIAGGFFAALFTAIEVGWPGSFNIADSGEAAFQEMIYYSYVNLATLGYGDILPVAPWARTLATFEVVAGSLYLAIVVARLVSAWSSGYDTAPAADPAAPADGQASS